VDDKIIEKANAEGVDAKVITERYIQAFEEDFKRLGLRKHTHNPRVTDFIPQIITFVQNLVERGHGYVVDGNEVFYSIDSFKDYGKLSKNKLEDLNAGQRVDVDKRKKNPLDFVLWKPAKPGEPYWDSPWGKGRPGWHIECSAMARRYLGDDFDIHAGGTDLIFPHHENEIAQSETATGKRFARYWLHNGMVNLDGAKMAKSTGNVVDLATALDTYGGMPLRLLFLRAHYRAPIEYSAELVEEAAEAYRRIERLLERVPPTDAEADPGVLDAFREAMDDDF